MRAVSFQNLGLIDLRAVKTFGVSVKEGENPIGFFGTGLKYAVAILLRNGHEVTLWRGMDRHEFGTTKAVVRGEEFEIVTLDGEELGLTTQVGKTWKMWQAFRELYCNTTDEGGVSKPNEIEPIPGFTTIVVRGDAFAREHDKIAEVILQSQPVCSSEPVDIHPQAGYSVFYRGVRVHDLQQRSLYTYNINKSIDLTEDRTAKHNFQIVWAIAGVILNSENDAILRRVLTAPKGTFEQGLNYSDALTGAGEAFLRVVGELRREMHEDLNESAKRLHIESSGEAHQFEEMPLTDTERRELNDAIAFCESVGFNITKYPVFVSETLGKGILGLAVKDKQEIWISRHCMMMGRRMLIGTLMEEFLHLAHGLEDESRAMQNFLFDLVVTLAERAGTAREQAA